MLEAGTPGETGCAMTTIAHDREIAMFWATAMVDRPDVVFLDTETTSLGADAEIVEIAVLDRSGTALLNTLVRPDRPIPPEATAIHGIRDGMVTGAPGWPAVYFDLLEVLRARPCVVVYNAAFDRRIIEQINRRHGLAPVAVEWHCAMLRYAAYAGDRHPKYGDYRWHSLERAAGSLGISLPTHRARGDAEACRGVVHTMASRAANNGRLPR